MADSKEAQPTSAQKRLQPPPEALARCCKQISVARRQASLYGSDHPATEAAVTDLAVHVEDLLSAYERPTIVFTDCAVVVNDRQFSASSDSRELCWRLRARGAMAITLAGLPPASQLAEFLAFLNVEPREVQAAGGPSKYLRSRRVTRIVATEAVYAAADDAEEDESAGVTGPDDVDPIVAAVLDWLSSQNEEEAPPRIPIVDILSNPDSAARLIREAVTKLHASRREAETERIAGEVVQDLRTLAGDDASQWDSALPQIRKAISKLPGETRPSFGGVSGSPDMPDARMVDVGDVEEILMGSGGGEPGQVEPADIAGLDKLFGAVPKGQLPSWQGELHPASTLKSSARTLETLMTWESSAVEHGRMARALAAYVPTVIENGDRELALQIAGNLAKEAQRADNLEWRVTNAAAALDTIETAVLRNLVLTALDAGGYDARENASMLIRTLPRLALSMAEQLLACADPVLSESLIQGVSQYSQEAVEELARCLSAGPPRLQEPALSALVRIGSSQALKAVVDASTGSDPVLAAKALAVLGQLRKPVSSEACIKALRHKDRQVRETALAALGNLEDEDALPYLIRIALKTRLWRDNTSERIAAARALARFSHPEALRCLETLGKRSTLLHRKRSDALRLAAEDALAEIRSADTVQYGRAA